MKNNALITRAEIKAQKSDRYVNSLAKHFARKVEVKTDGDWSLIYFPMGTCRMRENNGSMEFSCKAETEAALKKIRGIIESHVLRFGEMRGKTMEWTCQ
ncbi:MAG: DUF2218 domain-containing protein [Pseudomonadota bacterium]